jgi:hypothetical protein
MVEFAPITYEEIQARFFSVFHRDMTQDERRCFLLVDKYWISGYFLGISGMLAEGHTSFQHSHNIS